jgi:SAM-dependent methyltransferase
MASAVASGTEGYAEEAEALLKEYESLRFDQVHRHVSHLFPPAPAHVLEIGAGTGRDAAGFAALGYRVAAVEPTAAFRNGARRLHPSPLIEWIDDSLPDLAALRGRSFDIVMLTAVWMHLDADQRRAAMPVVAGMVAPGGKMFLTQRHGPVPPGRRMFAVSAAETVRLAAAEGLVSLVRLENQPSTRNRPGVCWDRLGFAKPPQP